MVHGPGNFTVVRHALNEYLGLQHMRQAARVPGHEREFNAIHSASCDARVLWCWITASFSDRTQVRHIHSMDHPKAGSLSAARVPGHEREFNTIHSASRDALLEFQDMNVSSIPSTQRLAMRARATMVFVGQRTLDLLTKNRLFFF